VKLTLKILMMAAAIAVALAAGYWWGRGGEPITFKERGEGAAAPQTAAQPAERKILYYRNPMGLADTSPVPKKDSMGMDYIPVYEGEEPQGKIVKITVDKLQKLGVKTEAVSPRQLVHSVRAVGIMEADERRVYTIAPKFEGWIEKLYVNSTGAAVRKGQALMETYSPELVSAQQEYLIAWKSTHSLRSGASDVQAGMQQLAQNSLERLRNWGISEEQLERLRSDGQVRRELPLTSPVDGIVLEKPAVQGMRFMPGEVLYKLADLSTLWLITKIFEQDLGMVRPGQTASIVVNAFPGAVFKGQVAFVYPTLDPQTRTAQVRIELPNAKGLLKPAMYANVTLSIPHSTEAVLSVPDSAVIDTGTQQLVLVERGEGLYEPRRVKLGMRAEGYVEVLEGLSAGEKAVVAANFLIDAESNLKAALGSFGGEAKQDAPDAHAGH
jgi:Cu(I)/Ag(I) efflux system membrane fusion protein